jgi:hypothetical protein
LEEITDPVNREKLVLEIISSFWKNLGNNLWLCRWNSVVNYVFNNTLMGFWCVTNLTVVSANLHRYSVTFLNISHHQR